MMAATKSRPECRASEKTPKLPVRMTRKAFRETNNRAETTLSSAARFFSFTSPTRRSIITHRDYRSLLSFAAIGTRTFGGPDRWKTPIGFRRRPEERSSSGLTHFETQGYGIYAVADVSFFVDIFGCDGCPEAWPTGGGVELGCRIEQGVFAAGTAVQPR